MSVSMAARAVPSLLKRLLRGRVGGAGTPPSNTIFNIPRPRVQIGGRSSAIGPVRPRPTGPQGRRVQKAEFEVLEPEILKLKAANPTWGWKRIAAALGLTGAAAMGAKSYYDEYFGGEEVLAEEEAEEEEPIVIPGPRTDPEHYGLGGDGSGGDGEEPEIGNLPKWLLPALGLLGGYSGKQRGGWQGALMGALGGIGAGKYIQGDKGISDWIMKNPQLAAAGGLLGGSLIAGGQKKPTSPMQGYQPYSPMTYQSLMQGAYGQPPGQPPGAGPPQMAEGGISSADSANFSNKLQELLGGMVDRPSEGQGGVRQGLMEALQEKANEISIRRELQNLPIEKRSPYYSPDAGKPFPPEMGLFDKLGEGFKQWQHEDWLRDAYKDQPPLGGIQAGSQYMQRPTMAQGGIASGEGGLSGLRTGLREAIINSLDDPNRVGSNSFVPSMLKAYDEIPKLQAGGITKDQYKQGGVGQTQGGTQQFQMSPPTSSFNDPNYDKTYTNRNVNYLPDPGAGSPGYQGMPGGQIAPAVGGDPGFQGPAMTGGGGGGFGPGGPPPGMGNQAPPAGAGAGAGTGPGGFGGMGQLWQNEQIANLREKAAAGGNLMGTPGQMAMTRGMAPSLMQAEQMKFGQGMNIAGFNQQERMNMASNELARQQLDLQQNPYQPSWMQGAGIGAGLLG